MPKKFQGENSKAVVARERKAAVVKEQVERKKKAEEDAYWQDDDKHAAKKLQRKEEQEKKRLEVLERKKELKAAHDEELNSIHASSSTVAAAAKKGQQQRVTQAHIAAHRDKAAEERARQEQQKQLEARKIGVQDDVDLHENVNRLAVDGHEARTVDEALSVLSSKQSELDRHPEKRMKAAFQAYEEVNLPILKQQHPTFRLSQLKQVLKKDWMKAPENPLNLKMRQLNERTAANAQTDGADNGAHSDSD